MALYIDRLKGLSVPARLIAVNVAVFVLLHLTVLILNACGVADAGTYVMGFVEMPAAAMDLMYRPWTVVSYMFVHTGVFHLLFNMLWLYWFGEYFLTLGTARQLTVLYTYGGIAGAIFFIVYSTIWHHGGPLIGASAAILAVVVATAWRMPDFKMNLFLFGSVSLKWIAGALVAISLISLPGENSGGNVAHLGGVLAGIVFAVAIRRGIDIARMPALLGRRKQSQSCHKHSSLRAMNDKERLDALLDKVRRSGYTSLTSEERRQLIELSNRL